MTEKRKNMRKIVKILGLTALILGIPTLAILIPKQDDSSAVASETQSATQQVKNTIPTFQLLNHKTGKVSEISQSDYVKGVVAAEMPISFEPEALKAQAVAAHTYALRRYYQQRKTPSPDLKGAQLSTDPSICQAFVSQEELKQRWGDAYETNWNKISQAVDEVIEQIITYDNQPIVAAYHSLSGGTTEAAKSVWGQDVPYLQPVDSSTDAQQPNYENTVMIEEKKVKQTLKEHLKAEMPEDPNHWFSILSKTSSGSVDKVKVGNVETTGLEIRSIFGLKSSNFEISYQDGVFHFTTKGHGHGVGMSQYGANELAKQGKTWQDIINHYYSNVSLININDLPLENT